MKKAILYTSEGCPFCEEAKQLISQRQNKEKKYMIGDLLTLMMKKLTK